MSDSNGSENGRLCRRCGTFKTWEFFDKKSNGIGGHHSQCKECISKTKRSWRRKKNMKKRVHPTILEFSKSDIYDTPVAATSSEKADLEKLLRSLVFDSIIQGRRTST